jgi:hypothetical protein
MPKTYVGGKTLNQLRLAIGAWDLQFWNHVQKTDGCWLWTGAINGRGYGTFSANQRVQNASRVSWLLRHGTIPKDASVCHTCDVPTCVNPDHLFIGTHKDNMQDAAIKGRFGSRAGMANAHSKLTDDDVRQIRASAKRHTEIASEFGICIASVSFIRTRKTWKHI